METIAAGRLLEDRRSLLSSKYFTDSHLYPTTLNEDLDKRERKRDYTITVEA